MKKYIYIAFAALLTTACSSLEDDSHYSNNETTINNTGLQIVNMTSQEYICSRADLSNMKGLFEQKGIFKNLEQKNQLSTMLVVLNDDYVEPVGTEEEQLYAANSHVSDISMAPSNMHNGDRIMMWHGKYVNIDVDELGQAGQYAGHIMFNNAALKEVIKTTNGYVYVISDMISTPTSLMDFINNLDDNYSVFRDMVLSSGGKEFDRANSKVIGVNDEGNTVYDSVFIYKNTYFEEKGFDMNSESLTATMLLFSNDVIADAVADANTRLARWGRVRSEDVMRKWIMDVAFFNKRYEAADLQSDDKTLFVKSIFDKQWGLAYSSIDADNAFELSNGVCYNVKKVRIPNNVLIYRIKEWFYFYENCTDQQKQDYFIFTNGVFQSVSQRVDPWTPLAGVWPMHADTTLQVKPGDEGNQAAFSFDITPTRLKITEEGNKVAELCPIPPGKYRLAMGFAQGLGINLKVSVYARVKNQVVPVLLGASDVIASSMFDATTYHYDRGNTLKNTYPEGYDPNDPRITNSKKGNYDTDGGPILEEIVIPDLYGTDEPIEIFFRIESESWNGKNTIYLNHWCLRPTADNY